MGKISDLVDKVLAQQLKSTITTVGMEAVRPVDEDPRIPHLVQRKVRKQQSRWLVEELDAPMPTRFSSVYDFVDEVILDLYCFETAQDRRWCPRWWDHPAAVRRLTMMWASWEHHRAESPATGEEVWTREVGDYHMRWLVGPFGPFQGCRSSHNANRPLDSEPIPLDRLDDDFDSLPVALDGDTSDDRAGQAVMDDAVTADVRASQGDPGPVMGPSVPDHQGGGTRRADAGGVKRAGRRPWRLPRFDV
ncbi:DUF4913 domain-containing protein [Corynebacterium bovis]|uniref:DUF4913 domain-containing protein n=1 Tax=Corynebacterium bovis TaxID=36808 RepID=UPI003138EEDD